MSARDRVLADIRRSLNRDGPLPASVIRGLEQRLKRPVANLVPTFDEPLITRFLASFEAVSGIVARVPEHAKVSAAVGRHLKRHDLGDALVVAPDPDLDEIRWSNRFRIERRAANGTDRVSVTGAFAGVAETGSVVLLSGPESPTTLNFLPEDHLVVLRASRIVAHLEDVWAMLRKARKKMPRTVNVITGPSKTGDVEQTIQEGAHGPRRVCVILVDDS